MSRFVADNSVIMAWLIEDETSDYAESVMDAMRAGEVMVPAIWPLEVGNALLVSERRQRIQEAGTIRALALLSRLPICVAPPDPGRFLREVLLLAREHQLSTCDASYPDSAMGEGLPLATQDKSLRRAAGKCGVPVFIP
jgi:predicted nucleic acid-binding protein